MTDANTSIQINFFTSFIGIFRNLSITKENIGPLKSIKAGINYMSLKPKQK